MSNASLLLSTPLILLPLCVQAATLTGLSFSHNDWEIACDNTGTCRAAGYQSDDDQLAVSVLLTRKAGPHEPVTGELTIGDYDNEEVLKKLPPVLNLSLRINGSNIGEVDVDKNDLAAELSGKQVTALLAALPGKSSIEWVAGEYRWHLSDKGAAAVLLKMDEFQGRIGTQGALIKKGSKGENAVLPPLPMPVVIAGAVAKPRPDDNKILTDQSNAMRDALRATKEADECSDLLEKEAADAELSVTRLTDSKLLASAHCWSGAYNSGYGYWVINATPPYQPVLVTNSGSEYNEGSITASHKGRGLGDCWSSESWTWDGKQFVYTESSSTGLCKLVTPGGAWSLPTLVTEIRRPPR